MTGYISMTEEERFLFDLKGYILFPAVLSEEEIAPIKEQCIQLRTDRESLSPEARFYSGESQVEFQAVSTVFRRSGHRGVGYVCVSTGIAADFLGSGAAFGVSVGAGRSEVCAVFLLQPYQCAAPQAEFYGRDAGFVVGGAPAVFQRCVPPTV